jgi:hypothetical protein
VSFNVLKLCREKNSRREVSKIHKGCGDVPKKSAAVLPASGAVDRFGQVLPVANHSVPPLERRG